VDLGTEAFVVADLPGLIEGAHEGAGLGHQFLRHVERTRVLVHLLDAGAEDPLADYETIRRELQLYGVGLADKPEIVVLNKIDLPSAREKAEKLRNTWPGPVLLVSGATKEGVAPLIQALQKLLHETAPEPAPPVSITPVLHPKARQRIEVVQHGDVYLVLGEQAEEAALKLGTGGYEALDELQDRLRRMGLDRAMRRVGARPGDTIRVGGVDLEWQG
jgi:GTP-binding protein